MDEYRIDRRTVLRGVAGAGTGVALAGGAVASEWADRTDPTTRATFRAIVDAVIPETPAIADELGPEHRPGGLEIGLDAYLVEYVNTLFASGNVVAGEFEDLRLAEFVAKTCDVAAAELLARGDNEDQPDPTRFEGGGPFASLSRDDRLRALALLDEKEIDSARLPGPVVEGSAGIVPQLVVAFTQVIYYSEWQGYDDISQAPSERSFSETVDGELLQSWQQTDFPGIVDGVAALRGYLGAPDSPLGEGEVWKTFESGGGSQNASSGDGLDGGSGGGSSGGSGEGSGGASDGDGGRDGGDDAADSGSENGRDGATSQDGDGGADVRIYLEPGQFADDDYDTSGYEEPFDTSGEPAEAFPEGNADVRRPEDAVVEAREGVDDDLLERAEEELLGGSGGTSGVGG